MSSSEAHHTSFPLVMWPVHSNPTSIPWGAYNSAAIMVLETIQTQAITVQPGTHLLLGWESAHTYNFTSDPLGVTLVSTYSSCSLQSASMVQYLINMFIVSTWNCTVQLPQYTCLWHCNRHQVILSYWTEPDSVLKWTVPVLASCIIKRKYIWLPLYTWKGENSSACVYNRIYRYTSGQVHGKIKTMKEMKWKDDS